MPGKKSPRVGRPPKPVDILKLEGGYRKHRHKHRPEAKAGSLPVKPEGLCKIASDYWDRLIRYRPEWWDESDTEAMTALVIAWALRCESVEGVQRDPMDEKLQKKYLQYQKDWVNLAAYFGLTPLDRMRMPAAPKKEADQAKEFLA